MLLSEKGVIEASDGSKHKSSGDLLFTAVLSTNPSIVFLFCLTIVCSLYANFSKTFLPVILSRVYFVLNSNSNEIITEWLIHTNFASSPYL